MTRPSTDHVVVSFDSGEIRCGHCADFHAPNVEIPASLLIERLRGFLLMHRLCPKPVAPSSQLPLPGTGERPEVYPLERYATAPDPSEFDRRYPRARTHATLLDDLRGLGFVLDYGQTAAINALHEDSGRFDAIAHWIRVEKAWRDHHRGRELGPAPTWLPKPVPQPEAWTEIVNAGKPIGDAEQVDVGSQRIDYTPKPKRKRGARPLTSPKRSRDAVS